MPAAEFEPYGTAATFGWDAVAAFAGGAVVVANGEAWNGQRHYDDEQLPLHGCSFQDDSREWEFGWDCDDSLRSITWILPSLNTTNC